MNNTTEFFFYYSYQRNYYKRISVYLSRQTNTRIPQQNYFIEKPEENDDATLCFIAEKQQKSILNFSIDSLIVKE